MRRDGSAVVVGHGPDLWGKGSEIDAHDYVVRIADCPWTDTKDKGVRTDHAVLTNDRLRVFLSEYPEGVREAWIVNPNGRKRTRSFDRVKERCPVWEPVEFWNEWRAWYRECHESLPAIPGIFTDTKPTTGVSAVLLTAHRLIVARIDLAAMTKIWNGDNSDFRRGPAALGDPGSRNHDFRVERMMLDRISERYGVEICSL